MMSLRETRGKIMLGGEQAVEAVSDLIKNKVVVVATAEGRNDMMQSFNVKENEDIKREFFSDEGLSEIVGKAIGSLSAKGNVVYRLKWFGDNSGSDGKTYNTFSCKVEELELFRLKKIVEAMFEILVKAGVIAREKSSDVLGMTPVELRGYMLGIDYHETVKGNEYWRKLYTIILNYVSGQYEIVVV